MKAKILIPLFSFNILLVAAVWIIKSTPKADNINQCVKTSIHAITLCSKSDKYVLLKDISKELVSAIVISEDAAFFGHKGFDWDELKKSVKKNISKVKFARGGSTITQQLAKNVYLSGEKSITRKLKEAYLAYKIEKKISKKLILEKYLNVIEFGPGIYGVKEASLSYFKKPASDINFVEAAFLAYLLPNPRVYSKVFIERKLTPYAQKTILTILRKMKNFKKISNDDYEFSQQEILKFPWDRNASNIPKLPSPEIDEHSSDDDGPLHIIEEESIDDSEDSEEYEATENQNRNEPTTEDDL